MPIVTDKQFRERDKDDFYETDVDALRTYLDQHFEHDIDNCSVLDPGAGTGVYGKVIKQLFYNPFITGVELNSDRFPRLKQNYDAWYEADYLAIPNNPAYHYVLGNPPYKHAEAFFWKSLGMLNRRRGTIDFLLRLGFLESDGRYARMWSRGYKPTKVTVLNTRPSFTGDGKTYPAAFAFFRWDVFNGKVDQRNELDFMTFERTKHDTARNND